MMASQDNPGRQVGLGVCGLGRGFTLMLPTFGRDARFRLAAATTPNPATRARFSADFDAPAYDDLESLCRDPNVEAVYIASPHQFHAEHVAIAARAGKHILVEKPLAVTLADGWRMVDAAATAGVHLIVGPSHSFDPPVLRARDLIASGTVGRVRMIQAMNYTDFLYRPRRPEELDRAQGGGVVFSQGAHQVDVIRLLAGGMARSVRAFTGAWDPARQADGAYMAQIAFDDGVMASLTYSGYAHYDSNELMDWIGELGHPQDPVAYGGARAQLAAIDGGGDETEVKRRRNYGQDGSSPTTDGPFPAAHEHFGFVLASCDRADLRLTATGVTVYGDSEKTHDTVPVPPVPRQTVMDELYAAVVDDAAPLHSGAWGLASLEVCLAILQSADENRDVPLTLQVPAEAVAQ